ncbi:MAG: metallophosphoesterase family protein [Candidatus Nanopelagicales bacterium]
MIKTARTIAVLSDIHGVLPVLDAVLDEPSVRASDLIVVTGDHAAGPQPAAVLDRLASLGGHALLVKGNADRDLVALARGTYADAEPVAIDRWAAEQLTQQHIAMLDDLPHPATVHISGFGDVLFCHGTPRNDNEVVLVDSRLDWWREVLTGVGPDVRAVVCGHTHMPFVRLLDGRWAVNSGSVGMPYGSPLAPWALIDEHGISLRWTAVEPEAIAEAVISGSSYPLVREWVNEYLLNRASDGDAIAAFGPRDGRPS